jgi:cobalt-zinc-cadmium efflux system outer membrane protein
MKNYLFLAALALLASCVSVPRDVQIRGIEPQAKVDLTRELTADEAVAFAMTNNPRVQVALADLGIARADLIEASTIANPLLETELRFPARPYRPFEVRVAQSLVSLLQLPRRRAIGRIAFDAAQLRVSSEVLRLGADVRAAYYDAVAASQHVAQNRTLFEAAQAAADVAMKQHKAGNITDLQLEQEQARYERAKLDLARAERDLTVAREELARAMGTREAILPAKFPDLPSSEIDQPQQRLDIAIAQREIDIAQKQIPVARLAALGEIELDAHYEREPSGEHTTGPGILVPIPVFNSGRAARTRAEARLVHARQTMNALMLESSSQLREANAVVSEARARVEYYRDVVLPRRQRIVELTKLEFNAMLVGIYTLLEARQDEARTESEFIDAQRDYWLARVELDRVLHGIAKGDHR